MKMKAAVCTKYGPPEVIKIEEVEKPVPKDNEVLIKIYPTTIRAGDCRMRSFNVPSGQRFLARMILGITAPRKNIFGFELAGEVEVSSQALTWQMKTLRSTCFVLTANEGIRTVYYLDEAYLPTLHRCLAVVE